MILSPGVKRLSSLKLPVLRILTKWIRDETVRRTHHRFCDAQPLSNHFHLLQLFLNRDLLFSHQLPMNDNAQLKIHRDNFKKFIFLFPDN